ncbi:hypothetical protein MAM1_0462c10617 [Mucor ambiguus]|uniref:Uncharacterized protein n=1 Tax=Mucor ambiguus TaxID=91626 RepID=A0A0C9N8P8_9FUNG|nr:hypothetical protein MAM1_0462c10617 [Mucor ambiguus]
MRRTKTMKELPLYADYRQDCTIKLWEGGRVTVDYGDIGKEINVLEDQGNSLKGSMTGYIPPEPTALDKIERYIHMLCVVQSAGHDVHNELKTLDITKENAGKVINGLGWQENYEAAGIPDYLIEMEQSSLRLRMEDLKKQKEQEDLFRHEELEVAMYPQDLPSGQVME